MRFNGIAAKAAAGITAVWVMTGASLAAANIINDFGTDPSQSGWLTFGDSGLFHWDSTNQNLHVTWDSSKTNSYFCLPLGTVLTSADDFTLRFDLRFEDYESGTAEGKPDTHPVTLGFLNLNQATQASFSRGAGVNSTYGPKNLVEFNFFPSFSVFLPTIAQTIVATNNSTWCYNHINLLEMTPGEWFHVEMTHNAATRTLTTTIIHNGVQYGAIQVIAVKTNCDFRCDTFSISSYSDQHGFGSLLAHGAVDNVLISLPVTPIQMFTGTLVGNDWHANFGSQTNWLYALERSTNLSAWLDVSPTLPGNGGVITLVDTNPPASAALYRIRAEKP